MSNTQVAYSQAELNALKRISDSTASSLGYGFVNPTQVSNLIAAGLIETNTSVPNPKDKAEFACRVLPAGREYLATLSVQAPASQPALNPFANSPVAAQAAAPASATTGPVFTRRKDLPVPAAKPRTRPPGFGKASKYPFDDMEVGESFHVPFSSFGADVKDPMKAMSASVAGANRKYTQIVQPVKQRLNKKGVGMVNKKGEPINESTKYREYVALKVDGTDSDGEGIRVWRKL